MSQDELNELLLTAQKKGLMASLHSIGDGAMEMSLNAIEYAEMNCPRADMRHAIVHCQISTDDLLKKFKKLNVVAHIQPAFIDTDMYIVEERVGKEKTKTSYAWKTMHDLGIHMAFGSDSPVISLSVMEGLYCAVTRKDLAGNPENGWIPEQAISLYDAVYAYTMGGAYASYDDGRKGSITKGKYADMVILDKNIFDIPEEEIKDTKVLKTILNGKIVYERSSN